MASMTTPVCQFGLAATDFNLPGTDGVHYSLAALRGPSGLLVMFICNHCPYVKAIREALVVTCQELQRYGIGCVAINSNDPTTYPDDDFEHMKAYAKAYHFGFPYLYDESQAVAHAYGAICTPDFFGYNSELQLQYRGRFDDSGRTPTGKDSSRDLLVAMKQIAMTGEGPRQQVASIGCAIKWRRG
ncbi:thioredoxin family protein [Chitinimonas sp. BJB300]|uniref:thioredoxin family protein n=1 Tax=Chitinimonas sp. BJB300 TaxID=1559339 RepID=UPI000C0D6421|nr:thioredoxin family protein [Chitinimonas sp. BJB300]PHV11511.1 thioredoxin family protein [Chitinimonas sp. BJB300]TSJ91390.1 thioredoxin family protein [Chitinimonas sp. BJB300]